MTGNVTCFTGSNGGAGAPVLTLTFAGTGLGNVASSPLGLSCNSPTPCLAQFASGTPVTLTASPISPSMFGSWTGCDPLPKYQSLHSHFDGKSNHDGDIQLASDWVIALLQQVTQRGLVFLRLFLFLDDNLTSGWCADAFAG